MSELCYIGIDTSNYTTSVAMCDRAGKVLANLKAPLPVREGERGLRQSDALFSHTKQLPSLMDTLREILHGTTAYRIAGVGYSSRPRNVEGSYMPCFLAGVAAARSMMAACGVAGVEVSHQEGHLMAALYSAGVRESLRHAPFLALHVSGGTTDLLHVTPTAQGFAVRQLGASLDLHAGQAVDRIGVAMGLRFPAGPAMEAAAETCTVAVPKPRVSVSGCDCHLSGLENMAAALYRDTGDAALTAAFVLDFIAETLLAVCRNAVRECGALPLLFAGGVMSNRRIRRRIESVYPDAHFAEPAFSADNAAGVALLCRDALLCDGAEP